LLAAGLFAAAPASANPTLTSLRALSAGTTTDITVLNQGETVDFLAVHNLEDDLFSAVFIVEGSSQVYRDSGPFGSGAASVEWGEYGTCGSDKRVE
jgi:hypothetical protein